MRAARTPFAARSTRSRRPTRFWLGLLVISSSLWSACSENDDGSGFSPPPPVGGAVGGITQSGGTGGLASGGTPDGGTGGDSSGGQGTGGDGTGGQNVGGSGGIGVGGTSGGAPSVGGAIGIGGFASQSNDETGGDANGGTAAGGEASGGGSSGGSGGAPPDGLAIEIWHDDHLDVGGPAAAGLPQELANVLGRVWFTGALVSASYRVNDGPTTALPLGATSTRLASRGDFNIEVPVDSLAPYPTENHVFISVTGTEGAVERDVSVVRRAPKVSAPSLDLDWSTLQNISELDDVAAIVDGHWDLRPTGVHVAQMGYDRLIAVGDRSWPPSYEVTAEVTLHDFRNYGGLGIAIGWQGHTGSATPRTGWPLEGLGWVRYLPEGPEAQIMTFQQNEIARKAVSMQVDAAYLYKVRSDRLGNGLARFSMKFWPRGTSEPADWTLQKDVPERAGSVLLVAHHAEVTWETLRVAPTP
jgi:hypothetical protein